MKRMENNGGYMREERANGVSDSETKGCFVEREGAKGGNCSNYAKYEDGVTAAIGQ